MNKWKCQQFNEWMNDTVNININLLWMNVCMNENTNNLMALLMNGWEKESIYHWMKEMSDLYLPGSEEGRNRVHQGVPRPMNELWSVGTRRGWFGWHKEQPLDDWVSEWRTGELLHGTTNEAMGDAVLTLPSAPPGYTGAVQFARWIKEWNQPGTLTNRRAGRVLGLICRATPATQHGLPLTVGKKLGLHFRNLLFHPPLETRRSHEIISCG